MKPIHVVLNNIEFRFRSSLPNLFEGLMLDIAPNKIHFVQGRNGAGKSTLFRILRGKIQQQEIGSGTLSIDGKQVSLSSPKALRALIGNKINMVDQSFDQMLASNFTFEENLRLANMGCYPSLNRLPRPHALPDFVARFKIPKDSPVSLLSGGQRQILAILMMLQQDPSLLLLDEPTATLDEQNTHMVMDFLQHLVATTPITILIISHDREVVLKYSAGSYFELADGKIKVSTSSNGS